MVQLSTPQATHLGLTITLSHKVMILDTEHQIQSLTVPSTKEEILPFLGIGGFLFSWIPLFLFLLTLWPLTQTPSHAITKPFQELQQALRQALELHLLDFTHKQTKRDMTVRS